jgi:PAS domain S-box-containing protein
MVNTDASCSTNAAVASPQQLIEVFGRLQAHTSRAIPENVYIYNLVEQHTLCSSYAVSAMLGYPANEIYALGLATLIHPADLQQVAEHFQRFATLMADEVIAIEYRMKRADGTWCWLRSQDTVLLRSIDGLPLQVLGVVQDITQIAVASAQSRTTGYRSSGRRVLRSAQIAGKRNRNSFHQKTVIKPATDLID